MKNMINEIIRKLLVVVPVFALLFVTTMSLTGCTKKGGSGKTDSSEATLTDEGELEISVPEDEETFGE